MPHTVHIRINDAATGQPTPVRIRFTDANGDYLAPFGRLTEFATGANQDVGGNVLIGSEAHAYIDGTCEIRLPPGTIHVWVDKGLEYAPLCQEVVLAAGKLALRFNLLRWIDLRAQGWFAGDCRAHSLSPHDALLEGAAEDLAVVNLLACEVLCPTGQKSVPAIPNILAFSGQQPALATAGHLVAVNTHNRHPVLGSLALLHGHRAVYPLRFGAQDGLDDWTLADWCDQCHRKNGLVVWTPYSELQDKFQFGEALADAILGKVDALEAVGFEDSEPEIIRHWYDLLNCGVRIPLVGSSAKDSNRIPLGDTRTYARLPPGANFSYSSWIEAIRAGRTVATNGPILQFTVNGLDPGSALQMEPGVKTVKVRAEARSLHPLRRLEVVVNGTVVVGRPCAATPSGAVIEEKLELPANGWIAARCCGNRSPVGGGSPQVAYAHSSPVYFRTAGLPYAGEKAAAIRLADRLDTTIDWARKSGRFGNDVQRENLMAILAEARARLFQPGTGQH